MFPLCDIKANMNKMEIDEQYLVDGNLPVKTELLIEVGEVKTISDEEFSTHHHFQDLRKAYNCEGGITLWTSGGEDSGNENLDEIEANIERLEINFEKSSNYNRELTAAVDAMLYGKTLTHWLLLKCEMTCLDYDSLYKEVVIHFVDSLEELKSAIDKYSCLPLPIVLRWKCGMCRYFYLMFNYKGNPKIEKLNRFLLNEKDLATIEVDPDGIQLTNTYTYKIKQFTFFTDPIFEVFLISNEMTVRKIIYYHMVWGHLQLWVRRLAELYKFDMDEAATQLWICHAKAPREVKRLKEIAKRCRIIHLLGFCHEYFLYVKLLTFKSEKECKFSITIDNVETDKVAREGLTQYYHQYFYINECKPEVLEEVAVTAQEPPPLPTLSCADPEPSTDPQASPEVVVTCLKNDPDESLTSMTNCDDSGQTTGQIPLIKTRTVAEINSLVGKEDDVSRQTQIPGQCNTIMKLLSQGQITPNEVRSQFFPLLRQSLDACYAENAMELTLKDETTDETLMKYHFGQAIAEADKSKSFDVFLDQVYKSLKIRFTNATCQKLMEMMIYESIRNKYSPLLNSDKDINGFDFKPKRHRRKGMKYKKRDKTKKVKESRISQPIYVRVGRCFTTDRGLLRQECLTRQPVVPLLRVEELVDFDCIPSFDRDDPEGQFGETKFNSEERKKVRIMKVATGENKKLYSARGRLFLRLSNFTLALLYQWKNDKIEIKEELIEMPDLEKMLSIELKTE